MSISNHVNQVSCSLLLLGKHSVDCFYSLHNAKKEKTLWPNGYRSELSGIPPTPPAAFCRMMEALIPRGGQWTATQQ